MYIINIMGVRKADTYIKEMDPGQLATRSRVLRDSAARVLSRGPE